MHTFVVLVTRMVLNGICCVAEQSSTKKCFQQTNHLSQWSIAQSVRLQCVMLILSSLFQLVIFLELWDDKVIQLKQEITTLFIGSSVSQRSTRQAHFLLICLVNNEARGCPIIPKEIRNSCSWKRYQIQIKVPQKYKKMLYHHKIKNVVPKISLENFSSQKIKQFLKVSPKNPPKEAFNI